jgi:anaerobic ribonucleoside-triphosphate reductase
MDLGEKEMAKQVEDMSREELKQFSYELKQKMIEIKAQRNAIKFLMHKEDLMKKKEKLEGDLAGINQSLKVGKIESQEDVKGPR